MFTDADWAESLIDRESTIGYYTFVWGNLVTWKLKKQAVIARSSAEAELRATAHDICEILWLKLMLEELAIQVQTPRCLYCDNKATISIAHNPVHHDRTKHIEVNKHFIKERLMKGQSISLTFLHLIKQQIFLQKHFTSLCLRSWLTS